MKRIFIAIDISEEARNKAFAHIDKLRSEFPRLRVGWERPGKLHLTAKFVGDIDYAKLSGLDEAITDAANRIPPFKLKIDDCGAFPAVKKARVLWLGVEDPQGGFQRLYDAIETVCEKIGLARGTRNFKPHLTIARLREPEKSGVLVERHLRTNFEPVEFEAAEIVIYESRLQPAGSIYSVVSKHKLKES